MVPGRCQITHIVNLIVVVERGHHMVRVQCSAGDDEMTAELSGLTGLRCRCLWGFTDSQRNWILLCSMTWFYCVYSCHFLIGHLSDQGVTNTYTYWKKQALIDKQLFSQTDCCQSLLIDSQCGAVVGFLPAFKKVYCSCPPSPQSHVVRKGVQCKSCVTLHGCPQVEDVVWCHFTSYKLYRQGFLRFRRPRLTSHEQQLDVDMLRAVVGVPESDIFVWDQLSGVKKKSKLLAKVKAAVLNQPNSLVSLSCDAN